jgi:bifunctional enzyme CysN/CysC
MSDRRPLPIVIVGHVDHGKSTLVGRLLHDTNSLDEGKVKELRAISARRGLDFEWSFLLDSLQVERDQGITVDASRIWFRTAKRRYVIIDAPGHKEFLKNMMSGAASAHAAVLVVDVASGLSEQTRRHAYLLRLLGVQQLVVAVNKMDLADHDQAQFDVTARAVARYLTDIGIAPAAVIPIVAMAGDNIAARSKEMPWYRGPTLVEALDGFDHAIDPVDAPLRLPIQDVYRHGDRRVLVGRIESGRLRVGDALRFLPGGMTARIASVESWNRATPSIAAVAGEPVALTLDHELFIERGHLAHDPGRPPLFAARLRARVVWFDSESLAVGRALRLRTGTTDQMVRVESIDQVIDVQELLPTGAGRVERNGVADIVLAAERPLPFDPHGAYPRTGRGVLVDGFRVVGGVVFECALDGLTAAPGSVAHRGGVVWLTGLSGSGKSTLANGLVARLKAGGWLATVLDGDEMRLRLNSDLGFSPKDRSENIRRVAEVARLMADAGIVVITALISPAVADRDRARRIVGEAFQEVYVKADLAVCEARDPKGLYARARAGRIAEFTGVSATYEPPDRPDLLIESARESIEASTEALYQLACRAFAALPEEHRLRRPAE